MAAQNFFLNANDPGRERVKLNAHAFIDRLPIDKAWKISVEVFHKTRTTKQRKALFAAAYGAIMDFMGLSGSEEKKELHRFFCREYYGEKQDAIGRMVPIRTTTTNERGEREEQTIDEALRFYAFIQQLSAKNGIDVPDPEPFWSEKERLAA